ncbi:MULTISPECIES: hypothetical protein [unclassified Micromonospora]|uniref:hypothetical protein n=1 Tax=unclassified Micromonospora TaxID=2617518 RepID=UPI002E1B05CC|nr:hypothetical protein OG990_00115 [Micromonospora sp. NBC_00858]
MGENVVSGADQAATIALEAVIIGLGGTLAVAAEPSGAGALAMAFVTPVAVMNVRSWAPFQEADDKWTGLAEEFSELAGKLSRLNGEVDGIWKGTGSEVFKNFLTTKVVEPLDALQKLAITTSSGCNTVADGLETLFWAWSVGTGLAIVGCIAANAGGPAGPAFKWAIIGSWAAFVLGIITAIVGLMQGMRGANSAIGTAVAQLKRGFELTGEKVDAESAKIGDRYRDIVSNPENWNKEPVT